MGLSTVDGGDPHSYLETTINLKFKTKSNSKSSYIKAFLTVQRLCSGFILGLISEKQQLLDNTIVVSLF